MKDLNDFLYGKDWEEDLATGLFLPPSTINGDLHEVQGGPQHTSNPSSFYFITRMLSLKDRVEVRHVYGIDYWLHAVGIEPE